MLTCICKSRHKFQHLPEMMYVSIQGIQHARGVFIYRRFLIHHGVDARLLALIKTVAALRCTSSKYYTQNVWLPTDSADRLLTACRPARATARINTAISRGGRRQTQSQKCISRVKESADRRHADHPPPHHLLPCGRRRPALCRHHPQREYETPPPKKRNQRPKVDRSDSVTFCVSIKPTSAEKCFQPAGFHNQSAPFSRGENKEATLASRQELR